MNQIPGPKQAQALAAQFAEEASKIGPAAAAARVITATQAVATVARYAATGTFAEVMIGGGGAGALLGNTASSGKPLAPRLLRELFEQLGPVNCILFHVFFLQSGCALILCALSFRAFFFQEFLLSSV